MSKEKNYNLFSYQILHQTKQQNLISLLFSIHFFSISLFFSHPFSSNQTRHNDLGAPHTQFCGQDFHASHFQTRLFIWKIKIIVILFFPQNSLHKSVASLPIMNEAGIQPPNSKMNSSIITMHNTNNSKRGRAGIKIAYCF